MMAPPLGERGLMSAPLQQYIVPFEGDELVAVQQPDGTIFVVFVRLCENLGLNRLAQVRRTQRHAVLSNGLVTLTVQTPGGAQALQCLKLSLLPLWLSGVQASRVKPALQPKLVRYQEDAADVLWQAFRSRILVDETALESTGDQAIAQLRQLAEMGRAMTRFAEQQIEYERQQQALARRVNTAARVIKGMQGEITDVQVRLGVLEDRLHPGAYITPQQEAAVKQAVKALAHLLTQRDPSKNHFQGVYSTLYTEFGVPAYNLIRQEQYVAVLAFLEDWRKAIVAGSPPPASAPTP